jgi:PiT family inorganic phosphate transporter
MTFTLVAVVVMALFFDFTNGFHDAANAIATTVATRALPPRVAVLMAGMMNFAGAFVSVKVATTVAKGIVQTHVVTTKVVLAAVVGATVWNLLTWLLGLPTSSSHALIGGVAGAGIGAAGLHAVQWSGILHKVIIPSLLSIVIGLALAATIVVAIMWAFQHKRGTKVNAGFRRLQILSGAFVAFAHGTNDAQKTMGVMALALVAAHPGQKFHVPVWVIASAAGSMAAGTYAGGWRIVNTLGRRVARLDPYQGFGAEAATAAVLFGTARFGFPVSTTHTISGAVLGAGAARRVSAVRWSIVRSIVAAWVLTLPAAGCVAVAMFYLTLIPGGTAIVVALAVAFSVSVLVARRDSAVPPRAIQIRPPDRRGARVA